MRISEAKQCIKELYLHTESVSALISERGVGKTSAYMQCAAELGIGYFGLYAAALEGPDFMGLPDKDRDKGITRYLSPQFLPTIQAVSEKIFPEKGLLILEEINRVPSDTTSVLYPLLLERKINGHSLASGWKIGVTMNPDTMNYSVNSLDDAMLDRFVSIEVTANLEDYIDYSLLNSPNDDVLSFLQAYPDILLVTKKAADSTALSKLPTPRGWTKVAEILNGCSLDNEILKQLIAGVVGPHAAASFFGYLADRSFKIPSVENMLCSYNNVKPIIEEIMQKGRLDIAHYIIRRTVLKLEFREDHIKNTELFLNDLPDELGLLFFKLLATHRPDNFERALESFSASQRISEKIIEMMM